MGMCLRKDVFATLAYGKAAYAKLEDVDDNFRFYLVERVDDQGTLKLVGCIFREVTKGKNKGNLSIAVKGTNRTVHVTSSDIDQFKNDDDI